MQAVKLDTGKAKVFNEFMSPDIRSILLEEGSKMVTQLVKAPRHKVESQSQVETPEDALERIYGSKKADSGVPSGELPISEPKADVASACLPCSLGHFSVSTGMLNEAVRFKVEGITSNEVLDRIAKTLEELNALERVDLSPDKIEVLPPWEKDLAYKVLLKSRELRHRVESIKSMADLESIAAETDRFYKRLNSEWFKQKLGSKGITEAKLEKMKQSAAQRAADEVEKEVVSSGD